MAVPRPVLFALLGIALCAAAFMATRGAREPGGSVTAVPAPVPAPAAKPKAANQHRTHAASKAGSPSAYAAAANQGTKHAAPAPAKPHTNAAAQHGAGTKPATTHPAQPGSQPATNPVAERVKRALADGKVVVFFFTHAGAADDTATREAV